jgi:hypothetical protein
MGEGAGLEPFLKLGRGRGQPSPGPIRLLLGEPEIVGAQDAVSPALSAARSSGSPDRAPSLAAP